MTLKSRIAVALLAISGALTVQAAEPVSRATDALRGEKSLGIEVGYNGYNRMPQVGGRFTYRFSRLIRLAPAVEYTFRDTGRDALLFDIDVNFMFPLAQNRCALYPLVGLNYSSWNYHPVVTVPGTNDVSSRVSRAGINLGAGIDVNISGSLRLSAGAHYTFIKEFHGVVAEVGIHYRF